MIETLVALLINNAADPLLGQYVRWKCQDRFDSHAKLIQIPCKLRIKFMVTNVVHNIHQAFCCCQYFINSKFGKDFMGLDHIKKSGFKFQNY